jgi:hypothetical protein
MEHPLDGVEIKMDRSREHITSLVGENGRFIGDHPVRFTWDTREVTIGDQVVKGRVVSASWPSVPGRFGAIIGDALTNMRAALDHLASQLFIATNRAPTDARINFPIVSDPARPLKSLQRVPAGAAPIIEAVQPYQDAPGHPPEIHPLHVLKLLVNRDKHEALTVTQMFAADARIRVTGLGGTPIFGELQVPDGIYPEEIGFLPMEMFPTDERWTVFTTLDPILSIDVGDGRMESIIELLDQMHRYVMDAVIVPLAAACF